MQLHKGFIRLILLKRDAFLRNFLIGEDSLNLDELKPDMRKLLNELDQVFYTLEFLERNHLINIKKYHNNEVVGLFNGFEFSDINDAKYTLHFFMDKFKEDGAYSWKIKLEAGLLTFVNNNFRTDEELKEFRNFQMILGTAVISASLSAILTAAITKQPIVNCALDPTSSGSLLDR